MFTVNVYHHDKNWRNGDLEDKLEFIDSKNFKTRKAAKEYIENNLRGKNKVFRNYHKGDERSWCGYYTGVTWQHENTGEEMHEYYEYIMIKARTR